MKPSDILAKAAELPRCKGSYARDKDGLQVVYASPLAVSFCARGAVMRASLDAPVYMQFEAFGYLHKACLETAGSQSIAYVNDHHFERMPEVWGEAIAQARRDGQ